MSIKRRQLGWGKLAQIAGVLAVCAAAITGALGAYRTQVLNHQAIEEHGEDLAEHKGQLSAHERLLVEIRTDVRWIREHLEKGAP